MAKQRIFGLATAISMIVGIVIGSGIFFKADDILLATGGNIALGLVLLCLGAAALIFGALSFSEFALRCSGEGGLMSYYECFVSPRVAAGFGLFQAFVYLPTLLAVVPWVCIVFMQRLFGSNLNLLEQCLAALALTTGLWLINLLSRKLGAFCQRAATVVKLIPIVLISLYGLFYTGKPLGTELLEPGQELIRIHSVGLAWLSSLAPIAYAFDGWVLALTITPEVKEPQKTMPKALVIGPFIVLIAYLFYFGGLAKMLGPEAIMTLGDASIDQAIAHLISPFFAKVLLIFIIVSILGVCNGLMIAGIRLPQVLSKEIGLLPKRIGEKHEKLDLSLPSAFLCYIVTLAWLVVHYICQSTGILNGRDITEIAIVFSYLVYSVLYFRLIQLYLKKVVKSFFKGLICPIVAILGALTLLLGGIISSPFYVSMEILLCAMTFMFGMLLHDRTA